MNGGDGMNREKETAWERFAATGKITDYLAFRRTVEAETAAEDFHNEDEHRRIDSEGDGCGRK